MVEEKKNNGNEENDENTEKMDEEGSKMSNKNNSDTSRTSDSSDEDDECENDESDGDDDDDDENSNDNSEADMPLFKYARLMDSLPRLRQEEPPSVPIISPNCSSTAMGKGSCGPPSKSVISPILSSSSSLTSSIKNAKASRTSSSRLSQPLQTTMPPQEEVSFPVLAVGLKNGAIHLLDLQTGLSLLSPNQSQLSVSSNMMKKNTNTVQYDERKDSIVSLSFDSSGTYLAACRLDGDVAIFELKYHYASHQDNNNNADGAGMSGVASSAENMLSSLFGAYTSPSQTSSSTTKTPSQDKSSSSSTPQLQRTLDTTSLSDPIRFSYSTPISKPRPTCIVLDPSYARRREKSLVAGFQDGRVVLTKQGFFGRFNDSVLYNGTTMGENTVGNSGGNGSGGENVGSVGGIESITWRGSLLAWADASGIKLYDIELNQRLSRIDRPKGARANLYPTISSLRPHMHFETSKSLIIVWGDCCMSIDIITTLVESQQGDESNTGKNETSSAPAIPKQQVRKVKCRSAWELDCVACGIQPIDEDHVAILGLILNDGNETDSGNKPNILQLQILDRKMGTLKSADALMLHSPSLTNNDSESNEIGSTKFIESASNYSLLSSFTYPRMEDVIEVEMEESISPLSGLTSMEEDMEKIFNPLGNMGGIMSSSHSFYFIDSHLRWSISSVLTRSVDIPCSIPEDAEQIKIILNQPKKVTKKKSSKSSKPYPPPPIMVISSSYDLILVRTRNIEDTITHYRNKGLPRLALSLGIQHKQILRQHSLPSLIHDYLTFLMNGGDGSKKRAEFTNHAARLTPMLLGGDIEMWERWLTLFAKVEGGLFALRDFIPVRGKSKINESFIATNMNNGIKKFKSGCM